MGQGLSRRLRTAAPVVVLSVLVALAYDNLTSRLDPLEGAQPLIAAIIGILIAIPLVALEWTRFAARLRQLPFLALVLFKAVIYVSALSTIFLGVGFLLGLSQGLTIADFIDSLPENFAAIGTAFVWYLLVIFFRQLDRLLGPGVLFRYLTGRYHRPRRERRVFMFVDITGATALSERLSLEAYYGLVNDFFRDVATPVLNTRGEIYEYIGDEVVITWKQESGARNANCVRVFFEIEKAVWANSDRYLERYGVVPEFKAALHSGEVIAAEMGDLKKEIAFNGEVLNVTSRIQGECSRLERRFLASQSVLDELQLPSDLTAEPMGSVTLRGTKTPIEIVAFA